MFWVSFVASTILYLWWLSRLLWTKTAHFPKKALSEISYDKALVYIWLSSMNPKNTIKEFSFGHVSLELLKNEYNKHTRSYESIRGSHSQNTYISLGPEDYPPRLENIVEELTPKVVDNYRDDLIDEERSPDLTFCFHSLDVDSMSLRIKRIKESNMKYGLFGSITFGRQTDSRVKRIISWIRRLGIVIAIFINNWLLLTPIICRFCYRALPSSKLQPKSYSCVSIVFDVFHAGLGVSKLLGFTDELMTATSSSKEASKASIESSKEEEIQKCLLQVFNSFGYLTEATVSPIIISPDIFANFMKTAKSNEMKLYEVPDKPQKFKETNVTIGDVTQDFETEEWLPTPPSNAEQKKIGRICLSSAFPIIWAILFYYY